MTPDSPAPVPPDGETDDAIHLRDPRHRHLTLCEQPVSKLNVADLPDIPDPFPGCWACVHAAGLWQAGFAAGRAAATPSDDDVALVDRTASRLRDIMGVDDLDGVRIEWDAVVGALMAPPAGRAAATPDPPSDRNVARMFHEAYERLAPEFGYHTREESAVPWERVPARNRDLMTATVGEVRAHLAAASPDERLREALAFYADKSNYTAQNPVGSGAHVWRDMGQRARAALAADRDSLAEKPETDT